MDSHGPQPSHPPVLTDWLTAIQVLAAGESASVILQAEGVRLAFMELDWRARVT